MTPIAFRSECIYQNLIADITKAYFVLLSILVFSKLFPLWTISSLPFCSTLSKVCAILKCV